MSSAHDTTYVNGNTQYHRRQQQRAYTTTATNTLAAAARCFHFRCRCFKIDYFHTIVMRLRCCRCRVIESGCERERERHQRALRAHARMRQFFFFRYDAAPWYTPDSAMRARCFCRATRHSLFAACRYILFDDATRHVLCRRRYAHYARTMIRRCAAPYVIRRTARLLMRVFDVSAIQRQR